MSTSFLRTAVAATGLALVAATAHAGTFQRQVAAQARGEVDISNIAGQIVIRGWDQPEVSVTADLPSDTQRVRVTSGHGRTSVCVTYSDSDGCNSPGGFTTHSPVRLEVQVPRHSELDVAGVSAGITSRSVLGGQHLHTVSGDIDADLGAGNDEVISVSGSIELHGSGQDGALHVTSVSGDLTVTNAAGELEARTVNGRLRAQLAPARLVRLNTTSGDIGLNARLTAGGTIETETVSGDEKIEVSAPAGYSYEARTFSGDIGDCFGQQPDKSGYGPGSRLSGTRGSGHGHVRIKSLSGGISLCDH
ncbi:MAG TPA: DUF4097 family beta strand repeat-containing protein [Steroidobacteraceae bacterium]|jgi:hypothetical protein|nr:DUF4097 family beta strand repeat-containing protein [Steroidobacteraceae bacterium]